MSNNDFSQYLIDIINAGSLSIMLSIGHRTGIFDVMTQIPPSTAQEIASKSNLNERYVKEWLGAMVTGRIVDYEDIGNNSNNSNLHIRSNCVSGTNFASLCSGPLF